MSANFFRKFPRVVYEFETKDGIETHDMVNITIKYTLDADLANNRGQAFYGRWVPGTRPEVFAENYYGLDELYWVPLMVGGIFDMHNEMILTDWQLNEYMFRKYGQDERYLRWLNGDPSTKEKFMEFAQNNIIEVRDTDGDIVDPRHLKDDQVVMVYNYYDYENELNEKRGKMLTLDAKYSSSLRTNHVKAMNDLAAELSEGE